MDKANIFSEAFTNTVQISCRKCDDVQTLIQLAGVNYSKGLNWINNYNTLRNKEIIADFDEIKKLGFNTIKRYGPGVFTITVF